jgi:hypothetical protein
MAGFFGRVRLPRTPFSRRSVGKMPYGTSAGRSSAGCGKTKRNRLIPTRLAAEGAVCWLDHPWS